jgi:hypothetical protein
MTPKRIANDDRRKQILGYEYLESTSQNQVRVPIQQCYAANGGFVAPFDSALFKLARTPLGTGSRAGVKEAHNRSYTASSFAFH